MILSKVCTDLTVLHWRWCWKCGLWMVDGPHCVFWVETGGPSGVICDTASLTSQPKEAQASKCCGLQPRSFEGTSPEVSNWKQKCLDAKSVGHSAGIVRSCCSQQTVVQNKKASSKFKNFAGCADTAAKLSSMLCNHTILEQRQKLARYSKFAIILLTLLLMQGKRPGWGLRLDLSQWNIRVEHSVWTVWRSNALRRVSLRLCHSRCESQSMLALSIWSCQFAPSLMCI